MTHTTLGWLILGVSLVGLIASGATSQPVETAPAEPSEPDNTGAIEAPEPVLAVDKPSDEPPSVTAWRAAECSDGSCNQRRGLFNGLFRRGR